MQWDNRPKVVIEISSPETGRKQSFPLFLKPQDQFSLHVEGASQIGVEYAIPTSILDSLVDSKQKWDNSYAVKVTMWMEFDQIFRGGSEFTDADVYRVKWDIVDSTVSLRNAMMSTGAQGETLQGTYSGQHIARSGSFTPLPGVVYLLSVPWDMYVNTTTEFTGFQAGNSLVTLQRGGSQWDLFLCIYQGSCATMSWFPSSHKAEEAMNAVE